MNDEQEGLDEWTSSLKRDWCPLDLSDQENFLAGIDGKRIRRRQRQRGVALVFFAVLATFGFWAEFTPFESETQVGFVEVPLSTDAEYEWWFGDSVEPTEPLLMDEYAALSLWIEDDLNTNEVIQ